MKLFYFFISAPSAFGCLFGSGQKARPDVTTTTSTTTTSTLTTSTTYPETIPYTGTVPEDFTGTLPDNITGIDPDIIGGWFPTDSPSSLYCNTCGDCNQRNDCGYVGIDENGCQTRLTNFLYV